MRVLPSGSRGLLVELDSLDEVLRHYASLRDAWEQDQLEVLDLVPAGRTILVVGDRDANLATLRDQVRQIPPAEHTTQAGEAVEVPVVYDGEDLTDVADHLGCSREEVVTRHTEDDWTVAFCGFAPGFGYLTGRRFDWSLPRRESPRTKVPARSVALAGEFSAVYPRESPGGWQLIGHAQLEVLDLDRDPPGLLQPGMRVKFVTAS